MKILYTVQRLRRDLSTRISEKAKKRFETEFAGFRMARINGRDYRPLFTAPGWKRPGLFEVSSVIPLFEKQIRNGGPVTVTHPDVTRYFMSIPEAAHLVLQSGAVAITGDICVLDMGEPVKIADLARNLIRMAGLRQDEDIQIEFTGLRPGDKLCEELLANGDNMKATKFEKIFLDEPDEVDSERLTEDLKKLEECAEKFDYPGIISLLQELVPTYRVQHSSTLSEKRG